MASHSVGFAVADEDRDRLDRLVKRFGGGNRSAFLRVAIDYLEAHERAERLRRLQYYGTSRSTDKGVTVDQVDTIVKRVLRHHRR